MIVNVFYIKHYLVFIIDNNCTKKLELFIYQKEPPETGKIGIYMKKDSFIVKVLFSVYHCKFASIFICGSIVCIFSDVCVSDRMYR